MTEHRRVVVTGAASGIGRATAQRLARKNWQVVACDIHAGLLESWAGEFDNVVPATADVSDPDHNTAVVELANSRFGGLDAVVLNAGTATSASIDSLSLAEFSRALNVNLMGVVHGVRAALPELRKGTNPAIVVTASLNGLGGDQSMSAYCASKFGAVGVVKALAREIGWEGIRVNAVCPGVTRTGMTIPFEQAFPEQAHSMAQQVPLGRWAEPDEIAAVIEFLAGADSSYVNGVVVPVDGGASTGVGLRPPALSADDVLTFTFS